jgi:peroxiredoxin
MKISIGNKIPDARLIMSGSNGSEQVFLSNFTKDKKTILIGMPGAFTPTCSNDHLPGLIRNVNNFLEMGINEILCLVSNDIHVINEWGRQTGAFNAGIKILGDPNSEFIKKSGLEFSAPDVGLLNRMQRVFLYIDNQIIKHIQLEEKRGSCNLTSGDNIFSILKTI